MKSERRHELQHNQLADWLGEMIVRAGQYSQALLATLVGIAIIIVLYLFLSGRTARQEATAWARYLTASDSSATNIDGLADLANQLPKTKGGQWARLALADAQLGQGLEQLFSDRAASNINLQNAVDNFQRLSSTTSDPVLLERCLLGLGRTYEAMNRLADARDQYSLLARRYPNGIFVKEGQQRLADLNKETTRDFYDWFARQDLKPPESTAAPGARPSFDMNNMPAEGPIFEQPDPAREVRKRREAAAAAAEAATKTPAESK